MFGNVYSYTLFKATTNLIESAEDPMPVFIKNSESLVTTVNEIFNKSQLKLNQFNTDLKDRIIVEIATSMDTLINKLIVYTQQGEDRSWIFNPNAKTRAIEYLQKLSIRYSYNSAIFDKIINLLGCLERYNSKNNRIDWHKVDKIIDAFKKIEKSSKVSLTRRRLYPIALAYVVR